MGDSRESRKPDSPSSSESIRLARAAGADAFADLLGEDAAKYAR